MMRPTDPWEFIKEKLFFLINGEEPVSMHW